MLSTSLSLLPAGIINGFMFGAIYALVALGLTLIYGVLHIINFAHGAMLMLALYSAYFLFKILNIDPYVAILIVTPASFIFGYVIYRWGIGKLSGGKDQNILLITLGLSIILENAALFFFTGDQQTISLSYSYDSLDLGFLYLSYPKLISFIASLVICGLLWMLMTLTDLGKAIRAVAKQREGARLVGIDVEHVFAVTFGIGIACLGAAGCMLLPIFYVDPYTGNVFVIIAFTIVVLGGMGSIVGALLGGFIIGITESVGGPLLGESLGQIGISLIFILILIFRPTGIFGSKA
ncbi:branched-chain amino acid ABC transporter permease [Paracoccaceae bacterium]|nr:branched-chain amino acid ABC transporter permease [Paracoccaceae bacterium]